MLIAIDENNNRIIPEKGKTGICQLCKEKVKAYCGKIYINHWRHIELQNCNTWSEGETEWHREWKNKFPKDWQEVIIKRGNEEHRADIKTTKGLILELQNSSISPSTIKIRENFYGNMVWLINANKFKENFKIRSVVTTQLRYLDDNHRQLTYIEPENSEQLKKEIEVKRELESEVRKCDYELSNIERKKLIYNELLENINQTVDDYITKKYFHSSSLDNYKSNYKEEYNRTDKEIEVLKNELIKNEKTLNFIYQLEQCKTNGYENFKYIDPTKISSTYFLKCALIEIESENTFFPNIIYFKTEQEFKQISKNKKYRLILNPKEITKKILNEIEKINISINNINIEKPLIIQKEKESLSRFLIEINEKLEIDSSKYEKEKSKNTTKLNSQIKLIDLTENIESQEYEKQIEKLENEHIKSRRSIMKKYKGLYSYEWKYKRKSWNYSEKKIFLDFENHIFEMLDGDTFKKMKEIEFIEKIKNWW